MRDDASAGRVDEERFAGDFETHVTVRCAEEKVDRLARWAGSRGLKFTHIVLERGRVVSQPMLTLRGSGGFTEVGRAAAETVTALRADRYDVTRLKIEAAPWCRGVPESDEAAAELGPGRYFEHHLKLALPPGFDGAAPAALAALVTPHAAHLSRNARRTRADGVREWFVTQRCRLVGAETAERRLGSLTAALLAEGYDIVDVEREFVVFDDDESLDEGWIEEAGR